MAVIPPDDRAETPPDARGRDWLDLAGIGLPTLRHVRTRRVMLVLGLIWIVGVFDLVFTLMAVELGHFHEANPLARPMLSSPALLGAFKFGSLILASGIFLVCARHRIAELACWLVGAVYVALALVWMLYYALLLPAATSG